MGSSTTTTSCRGEVWPSSPREVSTLNKLQEGGFNELQESGFDKLTERGFSKLQEGGFTKLPLKRGFNKLPEELEAAAVLKCSPHFLVTANEEFQLKYF